MKLSSDTLAILDNFAAINSGIVIRPEKEQSTMAGTTRVVAFADIEEEIPYSLPIYDLPLFMKTYNLFREPEIYFPNKDDQEMFTAEGVPKYIVISCEETNSNVKFFMSKERFITTPPKSIQYPPVDVSVEITENQLNDLLQASRVLNLPNMAMCCDGKEIHGVAMDKDNDNTSNAYSVKLGESDKVFDFHFLTENMKLIPGNYRIDISSAGMSVWTCNDRTLKYIVAIETTSSYKG